MVNSPANSHTITSRPPGLELNTAAYEFDYYSGSQIGVYIGDLLIDDIAGIQFSVSQSKRPIYGYGSQYYHVVAAGQVMVQGAFTIPFKEAAYINLALANFTYKMGEAYTAPISIKSDIKYTLNGEHFTAFGTGGAHQVLRQNIERLIKDEAGLTDKYTFYKDLVALKDDAWEGVAEAYEDYLWKAGLTKDLEKGNLKHGGNKPGPRDKMYRDYRRGDQYPPFDIWILYGDISNKAANHTIRKIIQCDIVGQSQVINIGGEPILEQYQFIGKNLV